MSEADKRSEFESMFRATYERVLAYALRRTDRADAEDVVAETYATAWRRFDVIPADPLPWLYGVARRTLANSRRSGRRRAQLAARLAGEFLSSSTAQPDPGQQFEDAVLMRTALAALSDGDREVLMLIAWDGLDNARAALVLGISPQALAVRLHRARRKLDIEIQRSFGRRPPQRRGGVVDG